MYSKINSIEVEKKARRPGKFELESGAMSTLYSVSQENPDLLKIHNFYSILTKLYQNEVLILAKFRFDWVKIADFFIKAYFWMSPDSPETHCMPSILT